MFRKILVAVAVVVVALVVVIATRPSTFHIERSAIMAAPPGVVFADIADFRAWSKWSPFEKMDPTMSRTYSGAPRGAGSVYAWSGDDRAIALAGTPAEAAHIRMVLDRLLEESAPDLLA